MYFHWNQLQKAKLVCAVGSLHLADCWFEANGFNARFGALDDGALLPFSLMSLENESLVRVNAGGAELKGFLKTLPSPEQSGDEDRIMINYTSMIQANSQTGNRPSANGWISGKQILAMTVESSTGRLGAIEDLVFDSTSWALKYFVCSDSKLPGRSVLIDPDWIEQIDFDKNLLHVGLSREILVLEAVFDQRRLGNSRYEIDV